MSPRRSTRLRWTQRGLTRKSVVFGLAILALALACRPSNAGFPTRPDPATTRDPYLILVAELESAGRDNLYDAVHQLRPGWFTRRTRDRTGEQNIIVYLDDRQIGPVTALRRFSPRDVASARYLSPTEAQVRYGQINTGRPAIQLELARQP